MKVGTVDLQNFNDIENTSILDETASAILNFGPPFQPHVPIDVPVTDVDHSGSSCDSGGRRRGRDCGSICTLVVVIDNLRRTQKFARAGEMSFFEETRSFERDRHAHEENCPRYTYFVCGACVSTLRGTVKGRHD